MRVNNLLIIPDINEIEKSVSVARRYGAGFEYNDFFMPDLLDQNEKVHALVQSYQQSEKSSDFHMMHGAFFDVNIASEDSKIYEVSDWRIEQSLKIACELGVKGVVFHTNYMANYTDKNYVKNWILRNEAYWAKKLQDYPDLQIYIENMFDMKPDTLEELAKRLSGYENFGVCFDYAHAHAFGKASEIEIWCKKLGPYIKHVHINDNDWVDDLHMPLGAGKIDWPMFKKHYETYFPDASVLIEIRCPEGIETSLKYFSDL